MLRQFDSIFYGNTGNAIWFLIFFIFVAFPMIFERFLIWIQRVERVLRVIDDTIDCVTEFCDKFKYSCGHPWL